jgi:glycosyltransferase involved in cell wall biosynthesis
VETHDSKNRINYGGTGSGSVETVDVVIVTLLRSTLQRTIASINKVIPNPHIILVTEKGHLGTLRNLGLNQCHTEYSAFIDDDMELTPSWFERCMRTLKQNPNLVSVAGRHHEGFTFGCFICHTERFKQEGGFPQADCYMSDKTGRTTFKWVPDAVCKHLIGGFEPLRHTWRWILAYFQTEARAGLHNHPCESMRLFWHYLKIKSPAWAASQLLWLVKLAFVFPFIYMDKKDGKCRKSGN